MAMTRYTRSRSRDTAPSPSSSQQQQQQQQTQRGNLESVLKTYDKKTKIEVGDEQKMSSSLTPPQSSNDQQTNELCNPTATTQEQQNEQHLLSATAAAAINIPAELNSANNTINSANISDDTDDDRERSMTLGSELDIVMKDGRGMIISDYYNNSNNNSRLRGDSTASASNFLNGLFDQSFINVPETVVSSSHQDGEEEEEEQQLQNEQSMSNLPQSQQSPIGGGQSNYMKNDNNNIKKMKISHTPPTQFGLNSYENSHFGKRMRSRSISGRLRSMSDLEESGTISREQKSILKDLVIAGDDAVQDAIDKYEAGDVTVLEDMIKGGYLLSKSSADVDLLGDLDLDFLNVGGGGVVGGGDEIMEEDGNSESDGDIGNTNTMMFGTIDDLIPSSVESSMVGKLMTTSITSIASDGLGDHEYGGMSVLSSSFFASSSSNSNYINNGWTRGESVDDIDLHHRMRANSLAVPGMHLPGVSTTDDVSQISFNRWMDTSVAERRECELLLGLKEGDGELGLEGKKKKKTKKTVKGTKKSSSSSSSPTKKEKKGPNPNRERKSQSKMKDMMEGMSSTSGDNNKSSSSKKGDDCDEGSEEVPSGLGRPRSMSDPNLSVRLDSFGLLRVNGPDGWVGAYSPDSRHLRVTRFLEKRQHRIWCKKVKYDVRKSFADSRLRVKGRFVKKEDEMLMRELMSLT